MLLEDKEKVVEDFQYIFNKVMVVKNKYINFLLIKSTSLIKRK